MIKPLVVAVLATAALATGCTPTDEPTAGAPTSSPTPEALAPATTTSTSSVPNDSPEETRPATVNDNAEEARVERVVDGDTLLLTSGERVRVLGIDSCERETPAGPEATAEAEQLLFGDGNTDPGLVYLIAEPTAPDRDRYDRLLRYVLNSNGADFGTAMVGWDHTGVYQGDNDADPAYIELLYAHDLDHAQSPPAGRDCREPLPTYEDTYADGDDGSVYVPLPRNDDDHHRHRKSRFCRKHWFC